MHEHRLQPKISIARSGHLLRISLSVAAALVGHEAEGRRYRPSRSKGVTRAVRMGGGVTSLDRWAAHGDRGVNETRSGNPPPSSWAGTTLQLMAALRIVRRVSRAAVSNSPVRLVTTSAPRHQDRSVPLPTAPDVVLHRFPTAVELAPCTRSGTWPSTVRSKDRSAFNAGGPGDCLRRFPTLRRG